MPDRNLSPEAIDQLVQMNQLSPDTAERLKARYTNPSTPQPPPVQDTTPQMPNNLGIPRVTQGVTGDPFAQIQSQQLSQAEELPQTPQPPDSQIVEPAMNENLSGESIEFVPPPEIPGQELREKAEERLANIERGFEAQQEGIAKAAEAGAQQAAAEAAYLETASRNFEKQRQEQADREAERQKRLDTAIQEYKDVEDKILNQPDVDPNRFWNSLSTGQKIRTRIALFLGGFAGGENPALQILNDSINRDIAAQKEAAEKLKRFSSAKQNIYSMYMNQFNDERQAEAATRLTQLKGTELQLKQIASQYKAPQIQARAQQMLGQLEVLKNEALAKFEQATESKEIRLGSGQLLPPGVDFEQLTEKQQERYVDGFGLARTKKGAQEVRELKASTDTSIKFIDELLKFTERTGDSLNPAARAKSRTLATMLLSQLRTSIIGSGQMSDQERAFLLDTIPSPADLFTLDAVSKAKLNTVKAAMQTKLMNTAKAHGLNPQASQVTSFQPNPK